MNFSWETKKHHYTADVTIDFRFWSIPLSIGCGKDHLLGIPTFWIGIGPIVVTVVKRVIQYLN